MKLIAVLTLLLGVAVALEPAGLEDRAKRPHKKCSRPAAYSGATAMRAPKTPPSCPYEYKTSTGKCTVKRSKAALKKVPANFIDRDLQQRQESFRAVQRLRRQTQPSDFYECANSVSANLLCRRQYSTGESASGLTVDSRTPRPPRPTATSWSTRSCRPTTRSSSRPGRA